MSARKPITIIGGGLAGLSLGIALREFDVPVTVWEAGRFPRHRVCGEFISGSGQAMLRRIGVWNSFVEAGAGQATTTAFFSGAFTAPVRILPQPALCLSRYDMDAILARRFVDLGGELLEESRWRDRCDREGIVQATGRRAVPVVEGRRWFGFKVHVHNVALRADLEMHLCQHGYVGLCRLNEEVVNACGLFYRRKENSRTSTPAWETLLRGEQGSRLNECMGRAVIDPDSVCAVAGLLLAPEKASGRAECVIGDALTMIPPITGNGMSMAFEAAEMAIDPLVSYSRGTKTWTEVRELLARRLDERFARRLARARLFQDLAFRPIVRVITMKSLFSSQLLWRWAFQSTR